MKKQNNNNIVDDQPTQQPKHKAGALYIAYNRTYLSMCCARQAHVRD